MAAAVKMYHTERFFSSSNSERLFEKLQDTNKEIVRPSLHAIHIDWLRYSTHRGTKLTHVTKIM